MTITKTRRAALLTLGGLLATTSLTLLTWQPWSPPTKTQSTPTYVAPSWWDGMPPQFRQYFLSWDHLFWQVETTQPPPSQPPAINVPFNAAGGVLLSVMTQPGQDSFKSRLADFVNRSRRLAYLPHLIPGLDMSNSQANTRAVVLGALIGFRTRTGRLGFTPEVKAALATHFTVETHLAIRHDLDLLLKDLGVAH